MDVSVVIPTYNRRLVLERTLPTLFAQKFSDSKYEIIVVIDGSTDGTAKFLGRLKPPCALQVLEQRNLGQAAARNAGLRVARGDLVLFMDDDIICPPSLVSEHVAAHRGGDRRVVFGPVLPEPGKPQSSAADLDVLRSERFIARLTPPREPQWPYDIFCGVNSSAPRDQLIDCGGFDETFSTQREDTELGFRLWKGGIKFCFLPTAVTYQVYVKPSSDVVFRDAACYGRSELLLCRNYPEYRSFSPLRQIRR